MKTKKIYMAMAGAALMVASCATEEGSETFTANRPIRFSASTAAETVTRSDLQSQQLEGYVKPLWLVPVVTTTQEPATRGTQLNSGSTLESFGVSAYLHPTDAGIANVKPTYFYNKQATPVPNDPNGNYALSQDYYWPASSEALTFYAYTPYGNSNAVVSDSSIAGPQTINFTVASSVPQQIDLMTATAFKQTPSNTETPSVGLTFKHELTGVRFVIGDQFLAGWIKSIKLKNVYGKGTLTIGNPSSWTLSNKTDFSVSYNTDRPVTGEANEAVTTASETFLMIPQTLGGEDQEVEIVYQDAAHTDYTVSAPLTGTWEAGKTVTYAISSTDLTTLRIGTINFPVISGSPKIEWADKDSVGLYVVGSDGETLIHRNIKCTYDGTKWNIAHPAAAPIYDLPGQTYFIYYPYSSASAGQPIGYPEAATSADESADDFFANVIAQHPIATNQSSYDNFVNSDLCIAKATHTTDASTISATLVRKVGLAVIELGNAQANKTRVFTNNNEGTVTETANVKASSTFAGDNLPYNNSNAYYAYVKAGPNTSTSFSSATYSDSNKDAWEASLVFSNMTPGTSETQTAYSNRRNWSYVNAIWNYSYTTNDCYTLKAPSQGAYTLEVWGAQGGTNSVSRFNKTYIGGYGGYSVGDVTLDKDCDLYICVGKQGLVDKATTLAIYERQTYNGGGLGNGRDSESEDNCGGGATHIAFVTGELKTLSSQIDKILIVAGGGGGSYGYHGNSPEASYAYSGHGGHGGGYEGNTGQYDNQYYWLGSGGTQTAGGITTPIGGTSVENTYNSDGYQTIKTYHYGKFGQGGVDPDIVTDSFAPVNSGGGGGGGFYGGANGHYAGGGGGSGYIGNSLLTNKHMVGYNVKTSTNTSTKTNSVTNVSETAIADYAKIGNGYARITMIRW